MAGASTETDWAADRKVGFAMGILLVGVVAALFFRNEPLSVDEAPTVEREEVIDSRLRDRDVAVYPDERDAVRDDSDRTWTLPELLREYGNQHHVALPIAQSESDSLVTTDHSPPTRSANPNGTPSFKPPSADRDGPGDDVGDSAGTATGGDAVDTDRADNLHIPPSPVQYEEYMVRYGDTLSAIADKLLGSADRYQEIYDANRDRMASPDRLQVGATLRIPRL